MTAEGISVVAHTPKMIIERPAVVLDELRRNLAQAARRPRPAVRALPADATSGTLVG